VSGVRGEANDRYEPLPGLVELPSFVWRRLPRAARFAVAGLALAAVVGAVILIPVIQRSNEEHERAEAAESARIQRQILAETRREQRPRFDRGPAAGRDVEARHALVLSAIGSIRADASTRAAAGELNGPILSVQCEPYPPTGGRAPADEIPSRRTGRYSCLAVTSHIPATPGNPPGVVGHPYRARIDFGSGRYAFCKIRGRPGELAVKARRPVPVPRVCGG
jgi:hypothetical protein